MRNAPWRSIGLIFAMLVGGSGCSRGPFYQPRQFEIAVNQDKKLSLEFLQLTDREQAAVAKMGADRLGELFVVRVADAGEGVPNTAGAVTFIDGKLHFEPRHPFVQGITYDAVLHRSRIPGNDRSAPDVSEKFGFDQTPPESPTVVAHVYPSADEVPENLLKFYLHFSAPMSRGEAYRRIHLLDSDGNEVADPFLELGEELWDPGMQRFTLLFDPGRIKRGLKPREEVGPVLEEGKQYTLVVDRDWLDATGYPLAKELRKSFVALPPDESQLDADAWKIEPPQADTRGPLVVRFPEPLDHSLLERVVRVVDKSDAEVPGEIEIVDHETCWRFAPEHAWEAGDYRLVADTTLEDLAGNSIGRAFDVDVFEPVQKRITTEQVTLPFSVSN
jgi:hypothetical protein